MSHPSLTALSIACIVSLFSLLQASAQEEPSAPPPPKDGVSDEARLFSDEERAQLAIDIKKLFNDTGTRFYVDSITFLPSDVPQINRARSLRSAWIGSEPGILVSQVRSGSESPAVQLSPAIWSRYTEPRVAAMLRRAGSAITNESEPGGKLRACVRVLLADIRSLEKQRLASSAVWTRRDGIMAAAFLSLLIVGGLGIRFVSRRLRAQESSRQQVYLFPDVVVPERLGAPNGGGIVSEITYRQ